MKVVIVGCGHIGTQLASLLSLEGHNLSVVDRDPHSFEQLPASFRGERITGVGFDRDVLRRAGIERADAFAAVSGDDNTNIVSALIARREFRVPTVIARARDPERAEVYRRLGVTTISPTIWAANEIQAVMMHADLSSVLTLGGGEVNIFEIDVPPGLVGNPVNSLTVMGEIQVAAIVRQGKGIVPFPGATFQAGDSVYVATLGSATGKLKMLLGLG